MTELRPRPTVRRRRLSRELRALREAAGVTVDHVTRELEWGKGKLSRIENNDWRRPGIQDIKALLDFYEVTDPERREAMLQLARDSRQRGWWVTYQDVFRDESYTGFEQEASRVLTYQQTAIPGLLQTPAYAEAIVRASLIREPDEIAKRVDLRMERQRVLEHVDPLHLWAVIEESVIDRPFGTVQQHIEQLQRLLDAQEKENINLQLLPTGVGLHPGMAGSFVILEFLEDPSLIYLETGVQGLFLERPEDLNRQTLVFRHLNALALSPADTADYVANKIRELQ